MTATEAVLGWVSRALAAVVAIEVGLLVAAVVHDPTELLAWFAAGGGVGVLAAFVEQSQLPRGESSPTEASSEFEPGGEPVVDPPRGGLRACARSISAALLETGVSAVPLAVHLGPTLAEVFWDREPPGGWGPWTRTPSGWVWVAQRRAIEEQDAPSEADALPALARLGTTPRGELWLHLEAFASIAVIGDPVRANHVVGELVRSLHPDRVELVCIGEVGVSSLEARGRLDALARTCDELLDARGWPTVLLARAHDPDPGALRPVVAICDAPEFMTANDRRWHAKQGITVLGHAPTTVGAVVELEVEDTRVRVPFLNRFEVHVDAAPTPAAPEPDRDELTVAAGVAGDGRVAEVQVLGPVRVVRDGAAITATAKSLELIAYLACHPEGAADDRVQAALWPNQAPRLKTWRNRVWAARQALGNDVAGKPLLPHVEERVGRLSPRVGTDLDVVSAALGADGEALLVLEGLRDALGRVRGRPFEEAAGYEWAFAELHVAHAERIVTDAALRAVDLALELGEPAVALWATEQGLRCCPASEPLTQARMRAFHVAGDLAGVEAAIRDLLASLESDDPEAVLHADTLALYEELVPARSGPRERSRPRGST